MKRFTILAILMAILMVGIVISASAQAAQIGELFVKNHTQYAVNFFLDGAFIGQLGPMSESNMMIATGNHSISAVCASNGNLTWQPNQFTMTTAGYIQNFWDNTVAMPAMTWFNIINRTAETVTLVNLDGTNITVNIPPQTQAIIHLSVGQHTISAYGLNNASWGPFSFYDTVNGWNWTLSDQ
jgi:hypothetical protein